MNKHQIRKTMLNHLRSLSSSQRSRWSQELTEEIVKRKDYQVSQTIATFLSLPHEWDTSYLIDHAQSEGKHILVPKTYSQGRMIFVEYKSDDLEKTSFGVWEPKSYSQPVDKSMINWLHVPGLAWNQQGFRVGYGGGFYDRFLVDFKGVSLSTLADFQYIDFKEEVFDQAVKEMIISERSI